MTRLICPRTRSGPSRCAHAPADPRRQARARFKRRPTGDAVLTWRAPHRDSPLRRSALPFLQAYQSRDLLRLWNRPPSDRSWAARTASGGRRRSWAWRAYAVMGFARCAHGTGPAPDRAKSSNWTWPAIRADKSRRGDEASPDLPLSIHGAVTWIATVGSESRRAGSAARRHLGELRRGDARGDLARAGCGLGE